MHKSYGINQATLLHDFIFFLKGKEEDDNQLMDLITEIEQQYKVSVKDYFLESNNEEEIIRLCKKIFQLNQTVKIDSIDKDGRTLLHMTARYNLERTTEYLLHQKCDITFSPYLANIGYAFSEAISNGNFNIALLIIAEAKKRKTFDTCKNLATAWLLDLFYISRKSFTKKYSGIWLIKNGETEKYNTCVNIIKELLLCGADLSATTQILQQIYVIPYHYSNTIIDNNVFCLAEGANHHKPSSENHLNILIEGIILALKELVPGLIQNANSTQKNYKLTLLESRNVGKTKVIPRINDDLFENILWNVLCYFDNYSVEKIKVSMNGKWFFNVCWTNCLLKLGHYAESILKKPPVPQYSFTRYTRNIELVLECLKLTKQIPVHQDEMETLTDHLLCYATQDVFTKTMKDYQLHITHGNILYVYVMSKSIFSKSQHRFKGFFQSKNNIVLATIYLSSPDKRWKVLEIDEMPFKELKETYSKEVDEDEDPVNALTKFIVKYSVEIQKLKLLPKAQSSVVSKVGEQIASNENTTENQTKSPGV